MSHISAHVMTLHGRSSPSTSAAASFEDLAMPLFDSAYNFAYWLAQDRDDAEDLVQETYLKAFRGFASFHSGTNFRAWMFQILKNTFLSARARKQRREAVMLSPDEMSELPASSDDIESILSARTRLDAVQGAIDQLPVIFREVLLLCDVEEASYREIAEILSIPIGTVMSRLARARKSVRESLRARPSVGLNESWSQCTECLQSGHKQQSDALVCGTVRFH
jgi:RNA polymerase sigma-70 factor, ECF subfamily